MDVACTTSSDASSPLFFPSPWKRSIEPEPSSTSNARSWHATLCTPPSSMCLLSKASAASTVTPSGPVPTASEEDHHPQQEAQVVEVSGVVGLVDAHAVEEQRAHEREQNDEAVPEAEPEAGGRAGGAGAGRGGAAGEREQGQQRAEDRAGAF